MLEVQNLCKNYRTGFLGQKQVRAVNDVSFSIEEGEIFGLFGQSGCGKTTVSKIIMGLLPASSGKIIYGDKDLLSLNKKGWKSIRREIQMVYQHPQMSFNPRSTVFEACAEPLRIYGLAKNRQQEREMVEQMLCEVGVSPDQMKKFPHEISGGQAQRISFARTLALQPRLLILDEPTSMLDISVQAQILQTVRKINREKGITMLFISHDLDVVHAICNHVAVMENGQIAEAGSVEQVFENPKHPYTLKLLEARL